MLLALKRAVFISSFKNDRLSTFTTDTAGKLDVLWHNGDTLGVDGAQIGVLKQTNEISLTSLLKKEERVD